MTVFLAALVILMTTAGPLAAQTDSLIRLAIAGQRQVLVGLDDRKVVVQEPVLTSGGLGFVTASDSTLAGPIPLTAIRSIAVRRSAWKAGLAAGAAAGTMGGMADDIACAECGLPEGWGTLLGGVGGAAIGALAGSALRHWKVVYTAP